ncbi:glutamine amidotransferase-related protein [Amycolatopsis albispora]|uniref:CTP synthase (glutamine hydrolyzing) n=1 Tax=Amycolatopsis albispora TaxID=1804986 RepID=A0A344L1Q4_9PSEU|nr:hypothetical protein [Amycolatopsis albispora]AXB41978.1 hypothetical protein A4R43_05075 [Amycolatopsis albispora]
MTAPVARIALVGDRSPHVRSHTRIPALLDTLAERDGLVLDAYWIPTPEGGEVGGFDAIWLLPGSPYASEAGAVAAVTTARTRGIPFLGTCGGFQHALLEFAREVCGLDSAAHAENAPSAAAPVIVPLECSLAGHEGAILVEPESLAGEILGAARTVERYHCSYGCNPEYLDVLRSHGLRFTGTDEAGDPRVAELPEHPFFLTTLFQPELARDEVAPHPIIRALAFAAVAHLGTQSAAV